MAHLRLGEILVQQGLITQEQLNAAIQEQSGHVKMRIGEALIRLNIVTEEDIIAALGTQLNIPYATEENALLQPRADQGLDRLVPYEFAKENFILPLSKEGGTLTCAVSDPLDLLMLDNLKMISGHDINLVLATRKILLGAIQTFYQMARSQTYKSLGGEGEASAAASSADTRREAVETSRSLPAQDEDSEVAQLIAQAEEASVVKLVDLIIEQAIEQRASDIHIEPFENKVQLRYRIDGALYHIPPPNPNLHLAIVSRLKILARLDIAEKRLPQDGAISFKYKNRTVDLRISTIPGVWGEKVVLRLLDKEAVPLELSGLGFLSKQLDRIRGALKKPYGLFFVTGPTGSGKSTTLYAALHETRDPRKNIVTAEDPVEFKIEGINQVAVRPEIGLTFATVLRAFLRQDPDVIMVGEVRDLETAQICVRAALTGHFVLSTLHTNDASSAISRLMDIGVEPYLITPSLVLVLAQRLARKLCPKCKEPEEPNPDRMGGVRIKSDLIYKAHGCEECNHSGYKGRVVISEAMLIDDTIREMISRRATYAEILDAARKGGMDTLFEDGIKKVEAGVTTFDEVIRVTSA